MDNNKNNIALIDKAATKKADSSEVPEICGAEHTDAELQGLYRVIEQLRENEIEIQRRNDLLEGLIEHIPVNLSVQDEHGQLLFNNGVAAAQESLAEFDAANKLIETEENISGPAGERTFLTRRKPVRILDQPLLVSTSLDITERKKLENELIRRAYSDDLTGLANRAMIQEEVEKILQSKGSSDHIALAFIDLDNFKHINDYYSHSIGDALLVKVARRLASHVRESDILARISGDEFVLLVNPVESEEQLRTIVDGLLKELKRPFQVEAFEVFTSASIGVSVYPEHGLSYEALRRNADSAMYRAKSGAKGGAAFFDFDIGQTVAARMELEQRLRLAIRDRRFCCAFQPKVDLRSEEVIGVETLIRWRHDDTEIQPPGAFIGLAIELGLIDPITQFVLGEAINSIERLDDAFGTGTKIAVNVAAKQAGDVAFMRTFIEELQASGCAERFIVEVTEDAFIAKSQFQREILPMLRNIGVKVSIDDFGTGYSSLSMLADITADEIKVDRSFITDIHRRPRSQSVLKAIESVSYALGMTVIAEGIETFEELAYLQAATRIRYGQGFYFARPFFLKDHAPMRRVSGERVFQSGRGRSDRNRSFSSRSGAL
jgi:cyclic di-GMP phosphodiesterase Gmr